MFGKNDKNKNNGRPNSEPIRKTPTSQKAGKDRFFLAPAKLPQAKISVLCTGVFVGVFALLGVFAPKPVYSEREKRALAAAPEFSSRTFFSGEYLEESRAFYADTFPAREFYVSLASAINEFKGIRPNNIKIIEASPNPPAETSVGKKFEEGKTPPTVTDNGAVGEQNGALFIYDGKALSMFGGSNSAARSYAAAINRYAETFPDVQVYNLVVPTHIEFALPERYKSITASQKDNIDFIYSELADNVIKVDAYTNLLYHSDEYLYFATDHHWTMRGAYQAYTAFAKAADMTPVDINAVTINRLPDFLGTLYNQSGDRTLKDNPDFVEYPMFDVPHTANRYLKGQPWTPYPTTIMAEYATGTNSYSVYLHGDFPLTEILTENPNGRKIVVVKESFGNAFAPWLINNFQAVYVVDQRYFETSLASLINDKGITDLLFINNIFAANTPYHINCIAGLMYKQYVPPALPEPEPEPEPEPDISDGPPPEEVSSEPANLPAEPHPIVPPPEPEPEPDPEPTGDERPW